MFRAAVQSVAGWIRHDYETWPLRFALEVLAWIMSIGANIMFAMTVPDVPFVVYLSITVSGCAIYGWAAWTRKSFGMVANYMLLTAIDSVAFIRVLL